VPARAFGFLGCFGFFGAGAGRSVAGGAACSFRCACFSCSASRGSAAASAPKPDAGRSQASRSAKAALARTSMASRACPFAAGFCASSLEGRLRSVRGRTTCHLPSIARGAGAGSAAELGRTGAVGRLLCGTHADGCIAGRAWVCVQGQCLCAIDWSFTSQACTLYEYTVELLVC